MQIGKQKIVAKKKNIKIKEKGKNYEF